MRNSSKPIRVQTLDSILGGGEQSFPGWLGIGEFLSSDSGTSAGIGAISSPDPRVKSG